MPNSIMCGSLIQNSLTFLSKTVTESIFTKLALVQQYFAKNTYTEFYKNPTKSLAADAFAQTEGKKDRNDERA